MKGLLVYISILAFIIVIFVILGTGGGSIDKARNSYPKNEVDFISVVNDAKEQHASANELQKEDIKKSRNKYICEVLPTSGGVQGWRGVVSDVDATLDGDAVVSIIIPSGISIKTFNNSFSDADTNTIIKKGTDLFNKVYSLHKGDDVVFSGEFIRKPNDCAWESSLTTDGGLSDPEFIFRFKNVEKSVQ